ncbi:MAG: thiol peroxidase [bacterium]|nr:thiol peroxidase [bacterium]
MVKFKGNLVSLAGRMPKVGEYAPGFICVGEGLKEISINDFKDKIKIISSVPSLDTPVCSNETKKIDELMSKFSNEYAFITVSLDLPFAQKRWCGANEVKNVITLSDYKYKSFGFNYGVYVNELGLLARCVFIVDKSNVIRYIQLVEEITNEPDYNAIEKALKA